MSFWKSFRKPRTVPLTGSERIYAIGDIHGRFDLLHQLVHLIERDLSGEDRPAVRLIILGDFIDRGPQSAALIELLMQLDVNPRITILKGNHEAALVDAYRGDQDALEGWLDHGGDATLASFGVDRAALSSMDSRTIYRTLTRAIPGSIIDWLDSLPLTEIADGHLFVHAGIRPEIAIDDQIADDLLWIRGEFTRSEADHGLMIVHGHSVSEPSVCFASNRIGVDTGAWRTGVLSAVIIESGRPYRTLSTIAIQAEAPQSTRDGLTAISS